MKRPDAHVIHGPIYGTDTTVLYSFMIFVLFPNLWGIVSILQ